MTPAPLVQLGELIDILSGFAFRSECFDNDDGFPLIRIRDVVPGNTKTRFRGEYDPAFVVVAGDILIGMDGEFNIARWRGEPALLNQRVCRIRSANERLDEDYLFRFLPGALKKIERVKSFVTVKHLSVKDMRSIYIPLPPVSEQRRIAAILFLTSGAAQGAKDGSSHRSVPSLLTSPQWQEDSAKPGPRLGFLKILSCIVGGTISALGF